MSRAITSVNLVFDSIFVFVIVLVNDIVFSFSFISRFLKYFRFRFVFVLSFFNIVFSRTKFRACMCAPLFLIHDIDTTDFTVLNAVNSQFPYLHHNVTFNHVMCAKVQDKIKNNRPIYDIAIIYK